VEISRQTVDEAGSLVVFSYWVVHDNIFVRDFNFFDWQQELFESDKDILCRSLRLNWYLDFCYPAQQYITKFPEIDSLGRYEWCGLDPDYGYPMSVDGHIYRTKEILPLIKKLNYRNPNSFEGQLALHSLSHPKIICYQDSKIINLAINRVQTNNFNHSGDIDPRLLNEKFLAGERIRNRNFCTNNKACHIIQDLEIDLPLDYDDI